jgi:hypothetical protein
MAVARPKTERRFVMTSVQLGGRRPALPRLDQADDAGPGDVRRILRENGLSLALMALFLLSLVGHSLAGEHVYNASQQAHGLPAVGYLAYLTTGHFVESVFENWESEFLQMAAFVLLTVFLHQRGSPESKKLDGGEDVDEDPSLKRDDPKAPWPVRAGGLWLTLYRHSLSIALVSLFAVSFLLHALGGVAEYNDEQRAHGQPEATLVEYLGSSTFWFESLQNWQSEFLSTAGLIVLAIYLREWGSPESKPVAAPHDQTGRG